MGVELQLLARLLGLVVSDWLDVVALEEVLVIGLVLLGSDKNYRSLGS